MSVHLCCSSSKVIQKFHQLKCEVEHTNCSQDLKLALFCLHLDCSKIDLFEIRNHFGQKVFVPGFYKLI